MSRFILSPRAREDLEKIWIYSTQNWDPVQAEHYLRRIEEAVHLLAETPVRGRSCDHIRKGYRKYPVGSHILFYRSVSHGIDVVRILHRQMDFDRHLP
jgi:toxin ParE1/3/4